MRVIRSARQMAQIAERLTRQGQRIGLVPTMGALHEGHLSLIRRAASENDVVIVTLFVNPLQFGPREDFTRYPRDLPRDRRLARSAGAILLFVPTPAHIYPDGFDTTVDVGALGERWEGRVRPGHFRGVATVVSILFHLTRPTSAYFGQKDYQQALIIRQMIRDLRLPVRFRLAPTIREPDGLAMSSRNAYLTPDERRRAATLYRALRVARTQIRHGARGAGPILHAMRRLISREGRARIDYVAIVDDEMLQPQRRLHGRVAILIAARLGRTRLIDNLLVDVP